MNVFEDSARAHVLTYERIITWCYEELHKIRNAPVVSRSAEAEIIERLHRCRAQLDVVQSIIAAAEECEMGDDDPFELRK